MSFENRLRALEVAFATSKNIDELTEIVNPVDPVFIPASTTGITAGKINKDSIGGGFSGDGFSVSFERTTDTKNDPPTVVEFPDPKNGDSACIKFPDNIIAKWDYEAGAWVKKFEFNGGSSDYGTAIGYNEGLIGSLISPGYGKGKLRLTNGANTVEGVDFNFDFENDFDRADRNPFLYSEITVILPDGTYRYVAMDAATTATTGTFSNIGDVYDSNGQNNISANWDQPTGDYNWFPYPVGKITNNNDFGTVINAYGGTNAAAGSILTGDTNIINDTARYSMGGGKGNILNGRYGFVWGEGITQNERWESGFGKFNVPDTDANRRVFGVGVGTSDTVRAQALDVREQGQILFPALTNNLINANVDGKIAINKEYLESSISNNNYGQFIFKTGVLDDLSNLDTILDSTAFPVYYLITTPNGTSYFAFNKADYGGAFDVDFLNCRIALIGGINQQKILTNVEGYNQAGSTSRYDVYNIGATSVLTNFLNNTSYDFNFWRRVNLNDIISEEIVLTDQVFTAGTPIDLLPALGTFSCYEVLSFAIYQNLTSGYNVSPSLNVVQGDASVAAAISEFSAIGRYFKTFNINQIEGDDGNIGDELFNKPLQLIPSASASGGVGTIKIKLTYKKIIE